MARRRYWLMKSEPDVFGWDDLLACPDRTECWDGVRNYQARNLLRDEIRVGDSVLFYHSRTKEPSVVGTARVVRNGYPDPTQFDPKEKYYDPKSDPENPRWFAVDVQAERPMKTTLSLKEMRAMPELEGMCLLRKGMRLSVQPVEPEQWKVIAGPGKLGPKL